MNTQQNIVWHNPQNVPADKLSEGYRFLLSEEVDGRYATPEKRPVGHTVAWIDDCWGSYTIAGTNLDCTYQTREPLPEKYRVKIEEPNYSDRAYQKSVLDAAWDGVECEVWSSFLLSGGKGNWVKADLERLSVATKFGEKIRIKPKPSPPKMVHLEAEDVQMWIRHQNDPSRHYLAVCVDENGAIVHFERPTTPRLTFETLQKFYEHSADRVTWAKCEKPAKEGAQ